MPAVSVIMSAFNAERFIRRAVRSILAQSFTEFELIVIDDGSTDATTKYLIAFASLDARVRLKSRLNTGYVPAFIEAIAIARGRYLARMDADDIAHPDRLARQVAYLDAHSGVAVVGCSYRLIDERGRLLRTQHQPTDDAALQRDCLAGTTPICHPTAMFRRDAYDRVGGYDVTACPAEDLDLWLKLGEIGQLACLPELLMDYRLHAGSVSQMRRDDQVAAARRSCMAAASRRGIPQTFNADAGWRSPPGEANRFAETLKYGWWAFSSGERITAIYYGMKAIKLNPLSTRAWRLLACSIVKALSPRALDPPGRRER